jgi:spermidine synthase
MHLPTHGARVSVARRGGVWSLRVDGTHASSYRPGSPLTHSVWDALVAPLAWLPPARRRSVLVLGLGGGSAARLVRAIAPDCRVVGVESSAEVLSAARRWLDLDSLGVEVVHGCARQFLRRCRARFDAVIEDVFVGSGRAVRKPDWLPDPGLAAAARLLHRGGLLVSNAIDESPQVSRHVRALFPASVRIEIAEYDNVVWVGGPSSLSAQGLRAAAAAHPLLCQTLGQLSFRSR